MGQLQASLSRPMSISGGTTSPQWATASAGCPAILALALQANRVTGGGLSLAGV